MQLLHGRHGGSGTDATTIDELTMIFGYRYTSAAVLTEVLTPDAPVEDPREPSGRPGFRAPHVWLDRDGTRLSTLDLFDGAFTLLVGPDGAEWTEAAGATAAALGVGLETWRIGVDLHDRDGRWQDAYGVSRAGAVLVRPDGVVAWRARDLTEHPTRSLEEALSSVLRPDR
jgi:putative polyketide hydroxylase